MPRRMKAAAGTGDINGLYDSIKEDPNVLDSIDAIPFVDTPLHTAASAGHTDFAVEILRLKPSFGRKLNPDGLSSLHLALINHKFDTVKRLIELDKELIRVKGKQGETPLHFLAKKEDINADQQQRELDDHRVNTLADFLFACPNSIEDLTNQDETALHIAVRTKNKSAVEIILGLIRRINKRRLLANKDVKGNTALDLAVEDSQLEMVKLLVKEPFATINAKNSNKQIALQPPAESEIALDIALQPPAQSDVARSARALENSSCDEIDYAVAKFLNSPELFLEVIYKEKFFMGRLVTMELRNIGLVVAVLIATATFTSVLSPPGGVRGGDFNLLTDGGNFNASVTSTNNLFAANTSFFNATLSIPTDNPVKRLLFDAKDLQYGFAFDLFYGFNTVAFVLSAAMIMFVLPGIPIFFLLHLALLCTMMSYGTSFYLISPSFGYCAMYVIVSTLCAGLVYYSRITTFEIENTAKGNTTVLFLKLKLLAPMSKLQEERLMMLNNLLGNINWVIGPKPRCASCQTQHWQV